MRHTHATAMMAMALWAGTAAAGPDLRKQPKIGPPKTPTLVRSYSVKVYPFDDKGGSFNQFDGTKGILQSVTGKLSAVARYTLTASGTKKIAGQHYDFSAYALAYVNDTPASFSLKVHCSGTFTDEYKQQIGCPASGETTVPNTPAQIRSFIGNQGLFAAFKPDPITYSALPDGIASAEGTPSGLEGSVVYSYLPALPRYKAPN